MARRVWFGFISLISVAAAMGCGEDSGAEAPGAEAPPGVGVEAPGSGGASAAMTPGAAGTGQPAAGGTSAESPNAGIDGAPLDGNAGGQTGAVDPAGGGSAPAMGGTAGDAAMAGAAGAGGTTAGTGGATSVTPAASPFPSGVTRPRIMIVGDSISAGRGCYKQYLLADLNAAGFSNFEFVGEYTDDCGGGVRHSARSCSTAQQYTQPTFTLAPGSCNPFGEFPGMTPLMAEHTPDLVMLQLGVNDVWNGMAVQNILASYTTLIQQARAQNPNVVLAVAQIQKIRPMDAGGDATFARTQQLIEALPAWAMTQTQPGSPVFVADLWTNSDVAQTTDGVHPDDAGSRAMGQNWFAALSTILQKD